MPKQFRAAILTSGSILAILAGATTAGAQALPPECSPSTATAGATVECLGTISGPISTNVNDLTVNIGNSGSAGNLDTSATGTAITMIGNNPTLNINNASTTVLGQAGIDIATSSGNITVYSIGNIE